MLWRYKSSRVITDHPTSGYSTDCHEVRVIWVNLTITSTYFVIDSHLIQVKFYLQFCVLNHMRLFKVLIFESYMAAAVPNSYRFVLSRTSWIEYYFHNLNDVIRTFAYSLWTLLPCAKISLWGPLTKTTQFSHKIFCHLRFKVLFFKILKYSFWSLVSRVCCLYNKICIIN